jgi:hypothetical protein
MDSNTYSTGSVDRHPTGPGTGASNGLAMLVAAVDELAAQDLDGLADTALADQVLQLRRLLDGLEGRWLHALAAVDARGAAGAEAGVQAASTASWLRTRLYMGASAASGSVRTARALFRGPLASTAEHLSDSDPTRADEWVREPGGNHPFAARLRAAMALLPPVLGGAPTQPLEVGRTTRVVQAAQRTALAVRDGGCVFPGCDRPLAWCEAHHLRHWLHGGPTDLANLALCVGLIIGGARGGLATPATTRWAADRHPTVPNTSAPPTAPTTSRRGLRAPPA